MSDGRFATDYTPSCVLNEKLMKASGSKDSYEYRMFLQRNGGDLIKSNRTKCSCDKCNDFNEVLQSNCNCDKCTMITATKNYVEQNM